MYIASINHSRNKKVMKQAKKFCYRIKWVEIYGNRWISRNEVSNKTELRKRI